MTEATNNMILPFVILSVIVAIFLIVLPVSVLLKNIRNANTRRYMTLKLIGELFSLIALPVWGFIISKDPCQEHPFELNSYPTAVLLYVVPLVCYFVSAYFKRSLTPLVLALLPLGLMIGVIYSAILTIHFGPMMMMVIMPVFGLPVIAPLVGFIYVLYEFLVLHKYQQDQVARHTYTSPFLTWLSNLFLLPLWQKAPAVALLCTPILALLQFILTLFGQAPDSMISMFTESCGFLLSHYDSCGCGGDHYLCSIAANGNKKLVKPLRLGLRKNEKVLVNRQLLIANAFENWMEEHVPRLHRFVRNTYDSLDIPVNKWSKDKRKANVLYVFMKPLEWMFLAWLYCFDRKPETRIALQYLPKHEYESFKMNNSK
jgi:hypothetical protein